jgi:DNA polymerase-3 subunit alpha (Gram-positive type)
MKDINMKSCKEIIIPESYVVFDLETTGFSPEYAEIIEIGTVRVENGQIKDSFQTYVKPLKYIPREITALTGITAAMTENAPEIDTALPKFISFIKDDILVAHNASFDCRFIGMACLMLGYDIKNTVMDSLKLARKCIKTDSYKLENLKNLLGIKRKSHNAIDDCKVTHEVIEHCRKIINLGAIL